MKLLNALKSIISSLPARGDTYCGLGHRQKISLSLPRRSGKTSAIKALAREYSSLVLVPSHTHNTINYDNQAFSSIHSFEASFRGRKTLGLKYRYILIDESTDIDLGKLVVCLLNNGNLLEKDYLIIELGTPAQ